MLTPELAPGPKSTPDGHPQGGRYRRRTKEWNAAIEASIASDVVIEAPTTRALDKSYRTHFPKVAGQAVNLAAITRKASLYTATPGTALITAGSVFPTAYSSEPPDGHVVLPHHGSRQAFTPASEIASIVSLHALMEAGAHYGHNTRRWNPKMQRYIFGEREGLHILDLNQTVPLFVRALHFISRAVASGGKLLFVGTKTSAQEAVAEAARASGQHFVNHRWLGGMLTNWATVSEKINDLKALEVQLDHDISGLSKREASRVKRDRHALDLSIGGIRNMDGLPNVIFVIDANKEELAIKEANVLGIPVVAILDSNVSPDGIAFPIPGNDDAKRAIQLYCKAVASAAALGKRGEVLVATEALSDNSIEPVDAGVPAMLDWLHSS